MEQMPLWSGADIQSHERVEPIPLESGFVRVGTCGYSYRDWLGNFYPAGLRPGRMLDYYASRFSTVEIDSSYYRIPSEAAVESMHRRTPDEFRFTAKAPGTLTHVPPDAGKASLDDAPVFRERLAPLVTAGKLGAVLLQFPNSFRPGANAEQHLSRLREALPDLLLVAEFRHREWQRPETIDLLAKLDIGWCNVDEPGFETLLRPSSDVVGKLAYVRFHGRNAKTWWKGNGAERYHYSYTPEELDPWAARVADMASAARETYVFFNNHRFGHAASNAELFAHILRGA